MVKEIRSFGLYVIPFQVYDIPRMTCIGIGNNTTPHFHCPRCGAIRNIHCRAGDGKSECIGCDDCLGVLS
jgi:predicted RNA-binding Zn-ribbon protein involved in translation (DUF1610 family)